MCSDRSDLTTTYIFNYLDLNLPKPWINRGKGWNTHLGFPLGLTMRKAEGKADLSLLVDLSMSLVHFASMLLCFAHNGGWNHWERGLWEGEDP